MRMVIAVLLMCLPVWAQTGPLSPARQRDAEARTLMSKGDLEGAERVFLELAQRTDSWEHEVAGMIGLFDIHQLRGNPDAGMKVFHDHYVVSGNLGFLALGAGRMQLLGYPKRADEELAPLLDALGAGSLPADAALYLSEIELRMGRPEISLKAARRCHSLNRQGSPVWATCGLIITEALVELERFTEAVNEFELLLDVSPAESRVLTRYAALLAARNKDLDLARNLAERAVAGPDAMRVHGGSAAEALGMVLFRQGDIEAAVRWLSTALQQYPHLNSARNYLGQALAKKATRSPKQDELLDLVRNEPSAENQQQVRQLLIALQ